MALENLTELIAAVVIGVLSGFAGAWRSSKDGTKNSLERGNAAFQALRDETSGLRDRIARIEGAHTVLSRLGAYDDEKEK